MKVDCYNDCASSYDKQVNALFEHLNEYLDTRDIQIISDK